MRHPLKNPFSGWIAMLALLFMGLLPALNPEAAAQNLVKRDVVYLKNGSILVGDIQEMYPDSILRITLDGGSMFVVKWDEILKMAKEDRPGTDRLSGVQNRGKVKPPKEPRNLGPYRYCAKGYQPLIESGFLIGTGNWGPQVSLSLHTTHNWNFRQLLGAGIGIGLDRFNNEITLGSAYANLRGDLLPGKPITPYYYLKGGYGIIVPAKNPYVVKQHGGPFLGGGLGIHFHSRYRSSYFVAMGYQMQSVYREYELYDWWQGPSGIYVSEHRTFSRVSMTCGLSF